MPVASRLQCKLICHAHRRIILGSGLLYLRLIDDFYMVLRTNFSLICKQGLAEVNLEARKRQRTATRQDHPVCAELRNVRATLRAIGYLRPSSRISMDPRAPVRASASAQIVISLICEHMLPDATRNYGVFVELVS